MTFIPLSAPSITEADIDAVSHVLRSGMVVQGENVAALEKAVGEYLGIRNVVAVSNGTASLHLALVAFGIGAGDEVIVPAFSFVATANVVELVGARSVFVDIEQDTFNIDMSKIEAAITPHTKAIIPVHEFGLACDISAIVEIARKHELLVIEDAACALGAREDGRFAGTFGNVGSFSLHPRKAVTSGEGGLLTTNDDALAEKFRILRNHGIRHRDGRTEYAAAGFNYRMTDFQAALVRGQFERLDDIVNRRNELASVYLEKLSPAKNLMLPAVPRQKNHTWQTFHTLISDDVDRDMLIAKLKQRGIGSNYGAQCIPDQEYYRNKYSLDSASLYPNALRSNKHGLALPLYDKMETAQAEFVCMTLLSLLAEDL